MSSMEFCSLMSPRSPSSSAASSFACSPHGSTVSSPPLQSAIDTGLSSSASSFSGSSRPFTDPIREPPRLIKRPHSINATASPRNTHYSVLGVSPASTPLEIRAAYRRLALQHHPDVRPLHQLDKSTKLFAQINEAYTILADPQKKACYDMTLSLPTKSTPASPMYGQHATSSPRTYTDAATGRVYPSMISLYREWRRNRNWSP